MTNSIFTGEPVAAQRLDESKSRGAASGPWCAPRHP